MSTDVAEAFRLVADFLHSNGAPDAVIEAAAALIKAIAALAEARAENAELRADIDRVHRIGVEAQRERDKSHEAYLIAFDQAMHNGSKAATAEAELAEAQRYIKQLELLIEQHTGALERRGEAVFGMDGD